MGEIVGNLFVSSFYHLSYYMNQIIMNGIALGWFDAKPPSLRVPHALIAIHSTKIQAKAI